MVQSQRTQSVDSLCKSTDWFIYDWNIGRKSVNFGLQMLHTRPCIQQDMTYAFIAWCRQKGHTYLNKPAAFSCKFD